MAEVKTRRRGTELEDAILRAAAEELAESGYAGLTMERVAQRAGTNKNALYRRRPNRAALGVAAYRHLAEGGAGAWLVLLDRAVARGEAPPGALHPRVASVALVLLRNEYLTRGLTTVDDDVLVEIVDEVYLPLVRRRAGA
ncbi:TetR/AcrR family transcriptional regulator [Amycolatopsis sp. NPDC051128]|uniref:TetR/AcrR family transcriptional regulator n=1 Tax=Amycolatopsis sp. NPDC051128 TaxID=3155412 RepID=UPI0034252873